MDENRVAFRNIDEYIASFPENVQRKLRDLRKAIRESAPEAAEGISYGMPAFKLNGPLVYFAAFKNHIGFYPTGSAVTHFQKELSPYKQGKGSVQFPIEQPVPLDLVKRMVEFRVNENNAKVKKKSSAKSKARS